MLSRPRCDHSPPATCRLRRLPPPRPAGPEAGPREPARAATARARCAFARRLQRRRLGSPPPATDPAAMCRPSAGHRLRHSPPSPCRLPSRAPPRASPETAPRPVPSFPGGLPSSGRPSAPASRSPASIPRAGPDLDRVNA
nr:atherin-like [Aegilops tauschii subsp. strangulata]XP_040256234.1 atherin-like [Aegilops tauschii subsp. strangulata]